MVPQIVAHFPFDVFKDSFHLFIFAVKLLHSVPCARQVLQDIITVSKQGSGTRHLNDSKLSYLPVARGQVTHVRDFTRRQVRRTALRGEIQAVCWLPCSTESLYFLEGT